MNGRRALPIRPCHHLHFPFSTFTFSRTPSQKPLLYIENTVEKVKAIGECLWHSIIPFIIEDGKKHFYYRGLSEWSRERGWLKDTCLDGQDTFIRLLDALDIPHQ